MRSIAMAKLTALARRKLLSSSSLAYFFGVLSLSLLLYIRFHLTCPTCLTSLMPTQRRALPDWIEPYGTSSARPEWCQRLEQAPRARPLVPLFGECGRKHNEVLCADGKPSFFGWKSEDLYTWSRHFRHLKRPGVFLDVAANDPVSRSNTFFYEQCLGWRGLCVEANPFYFPLLRAKRTCALVKRCVSNRRHTVTFADSKGLGGVLDTNKNRGGRGLKTNHLREIECIETQAALSALGETTIDFMSLDVEGHELFVLRGIDWSLTKINVIVTESQKPELKRYLEKQGFQLHTVERPGAWDALRGDRLFVHERVTWGSPV